MRPAQFSEAQLIQRLLDGSLKPGDQLPAERLLAPELGVTRPTLRETLKKLHRDGWIEIRHGKPTRIRDFWREGGLNVLNGLSHASRPIIDRVVDHLLEVRAVIAPVYAELAVQHHATEICARLQSAPDTGAESSVFCLFDWELHHHLALWSTNPIYPLILNGFKKIYEKVGLVYFTHIQNRSASVDYYNALMESASDGDASRARTVTERAMLESTRLWLKRGQA